MNDFFNIPEDATSQSNPNQSYEKKVDENLYDPNPDLSNGVYKSVIRFIPNIRNGNKESKYTKYSAKIWNPIARKSIVVDCPSNENKPSVLWTLSTIFGRLYKEEPTIVKEINENFSRWYTHHSYVYVSKDPTMPNLTGQIKIFKYRAQINELLEQQMNPDEDGLIEAKKVNPFHLLTGKDFLCVVGKKTKNWRDWTKCKFMDEQTPFRFNIKDTEVVMKEDAGAIKLITEFFDKTAPSMDPYKHIPWTDETYVQVAEGLKAAIPYKQVIDMLINETRDEKMKELLSKGNITSTVSNPASENISFGGTTETTVTEATTPDLGTADTKQSDLGNDEYEDIFKNL